VVFCLFIWICRGFKYLSWVWNLSRVCGYAGI
jgi:hypothetical protein